jgi:5-methylcytosine-specific restriction endonuclease McrA
MKRLTIPPFTELEIFDACLGEMDAITRAPFDESRDHILATAESFTAQSAISAWCHLPRARHGHREDIVAGKLSKGAMMDLYDVGVVKSKGQPRNIYDKILVASQGRCPYCADIGDARTLDHYLPKAKFPGLSVHPYNLIPACRDCNTDAGAGYPTLLEFQPINPYLDKDCFFVERWIRAELILCDPPVVRYFSNPPTYWTDVDKERATKHFTDCKLQSRFAKQVAGDLGPLILQRKTSLSVFTPAQFEAHLRVVADDDTLLLNGWKRTMYLALCESDWFCSADFNKLVY